jgi:hypothetical protein
MSDRYRKSGVFASATGYKCRHCRTKYPPGAKFVLYEDPNAFAGERPDPWEGCEGCAGIYADIVTMTG